MARSSNPGNPARFVVFLGVMVAAHIAAAQDATPLLRLQRSIAALEIESNVKHAQGLSGVTTGNPGDIWRYPNSLSCLLVYGDGRYVLEKRDEKTVGKPKTKLAEGSFTTEELQQMKAILDDEALRKITSPPMPTPPDDTVAVHEIETLNARIDRGGNLQQFMTVRERLKTTAMTGLDTFVDNSTQYRKTLTPLMKWFEGVEKKSKSALKDSKPQYCEAMNIE